MIESRRKLLITLCAAGAPLGIFARMLRGQSRVPPLPQAGRPNEEDANAPKLDPKILLEANQRDIKKDVERLYQLAGELKNEVEKTDSAKVLSLALVKKAEEIEKLAKEIKSRAKG